VSEPVLGSGSAGAVPTPDGDVVAPAPTPRPSPGADDAPLTGDAAVDEALRSLQGVEDHDLRTQVAAFEDVHGALQDRLADAEG